MKPTIRIAVFGLCAVLFGIAVAKSQSTSTSTVYFLAAGPKLSQPQDNPQASDYESCVVPVSDANAIATIRSLIAQAKYPVVNVQIQARADGVNRDFYTPGAPVWNWSVVQLLSIQGDPYDVFPVEHPTPPEERYGSASMIAADPQAWIAKHGDQLALQWFPLTTEVDPSKLPVRSDAAAPVMANLSSRANTAKGQDVLIGGISVSGDRPKQIAIRCSGLYLLQPRGVGTTVVPRVKMFGSDGSQLAVLFNQRRYELAARFPALFYPGANNDTLAIVTLYPGQYTFQVYDPDGTTGVVLFETYDLSLAPQPFP